MTRTATQPIRGAAMRESLAELRAELQAMTRQFGDCGDRNDRCDDGLGELRESVSCARWSST